MVSVTSLCQRRYRLGYPCLSIFDKLAALLQSERRDYDKCRLKVAEHRQLLPARQRSEQYFTLSQSRAHFLRHAKGKPQATQVFCGRFAFLIILGTGSAPKVKRELRSLLAALTNAIRSALTAAMFCNHSLRLSPRSW
jgi:hypothetical protein